MDYGKQNRAKNQRRRTWFFREREHLIFLKKVVVPAWLAKKTRRKLILWSCACATGEEVYSVAMFLDRMHASAPGQGFRFKIIGSDRDRSSVAFAQFGAFRRTDVRNDVPASYRKSYFKFPETQTGLVRIDSRIRESVEFRVFDFAVSDYARLERPNVIFCHNALGRQPLRLIEKVLREFHRKAADDAYLLVRPAEALRNARHGWSEVKPGVYYKC